MENSINPSIALYLRDHMYTHVHVHTCATCTHMYDVMYVCSMYVLYVYIHTCTQCTHSCMYMLYTLHCTGKNFLKSVLLVHPNGNLTYEYGS
jgi:hypothetical protein